MTKAHRLTPVQRKVLMWMQSREGQLRIITGYKTTALGTVDGGTEEVIACQTTVLYFLMRHGYIESAHGISMYRLTAKATAALGVA